MIPILYDRGYITPVRLGKGKMGDVLRCEIFEEINGEYSLEFDYPITGALYSELIEGGSVLVFGPSDENATGSAPELFDIYKHSIPIDGKVTFYCNHISRRLANTIYPGGTLLVSNYNRVYRASYSYPADYDGLKVTSNPTVLTGSVGFEIPKNGLACLIGSETSFASSIGGEFVFRTARTVVDGEYRAQLVVSYVARRGADRGAEIRYGANLLSLEKTQDNTEAFNAYVPYWDDGNGNKTFVTGYIVQPTAPVTPIIAVPLDLSDVFSTTPTEAQLATYAQNLLDTNTPWKGQSSITLDFINDAEIDTNGADIYIGDTVDVYWSGADVAEKMRVVAYRYDVLAEKYIELQLGSQATEFVATTADSSSGGGSSGGRPGIPAGGIISQVLTKLSNTDYDVGWRTGNYLLHFTTAISSLPFTINDAAITSTMAVLECVFGTPSALRTDLYWTTADGSLTFSAYNSSTLQGTTTVDVILGTIG